MRAEFDHFLALDDYTANLIAIVKVSGSLGTATGKHFFLPGLFFESHAKHPFVAQDKRATPIDVEYPKMEQDDMTYHLPPGFAVESAPQLADVSWPGYAALRDQLGIQSRISRGGANLCSQLCRARSKVYNDLRDFYQKQATADQQQVVLKRTAVATGN